MAEEQKSKLRLEIAHVLFLDIVGYSKLLIDEQSEALEQLNDIVRNTETLREAEAAAQIVQLPTGDGMALVFTGSVEQPVECALEISQALRAQPSIPVRMGIHSGPVHHVADVNQRENIAGAGINIAQRVMDCGDAGHILVSKRVADDLAQFRRWQPYLHDLGDIEAKHGVVVSVVSLYADDVGNPQPPARFKQAELSRQQQALPTRSKVSPVALIIIALLLFSVAVVAIIFGPAVLKQINQPTGSNAAGSASELPAKSIAVLPFENFSESKENEFFADGVQDDILTALSKVADLKVISRTSVMTYAAGARRNLKEIAKALGVSHILEGSVRRADGKVRLSAQLIDARNDAHVWAETYDRDLSDVFAIQSEIARTIAQQLQARLSPPEKTALEEQPTTDLEAHDFYMRAKSLNESSSYDARRREKLLQAVELLNQAIARDPNFFAAYCLLENTQALLYFYGGDHLPERRAAAEAALNGAARLRPAAGETHLARADYRYRCYLDYEGARSEAAIAQRLLPNNSQVFALLGYIARRENKWQESTEQLEHALQLDPRNWFYLQQNALSYVFLRRYSELASTLDRVLAIKPGDVNTRVARAAVEMDAHGDTAPLRKTFDEIASQDPNALGGSAQSFMVLAMNERDPEAIRRALAVSPSRGIEFESVVVPRPFWEGLIARLQSDSAGAKQAFAAARPQVEQMLRDQPQFGAAFCSLAIIDAALGEKEKAMAEIQQARELVPVEKEYVNGSTILWFSAVVYACVGEKDRALEELDRVTHMPSTVSYGSLRLSPWWDPLRGDPRFEKIVASLAPKE